MKKAILLSLTILFCMSANAQWWGKDAIKGNGKVTKETRDVGEYDGIKCAGFMDFILVAGDEGKITLEGEENLLEEIVTEIKGDDLVIKVKNKVNLKPSWGKGIVITVPFRDISYVSLAGSGDLYTKDTIKADSFKVSLAGSGDVNIDIEAQSVKGSLAGSGDLVLKGRTVNLDASVAGSGDISAFGLQSDHTEVSIAGSGDAEVVSNKSLKARVAGSGDIEYRGNPEKEDTKVSGSGSISN